MSRFAVLEHDEITMLRAAVDTLELSEVAGEALHLERGVGRRVWLVQSRTGQFTYEVPDHDTLPGRPLAISDRIRRFAAVFTDTPVELSLADDATVVATADTASAAVDLVASHGESPQALRFEATATATVPLMRFHSLMWSARTVPLGIEDPDYPFPPMWLQIADGSIGLHVDWSDFLPSRATYRLGATTHRGSATVAISPLLVETFLARVLEARQDALVDLEVMISMGTASDRSVAPARPALRFEAHGWTLVLWVSDALHLRWGTRVDHQLGSAGFEVTDRTANVWTLRVDDCELTVGLHAGHPDIARVSTALSLDRKSTRLNSSH